VVEGMLVDVVLLHVVSLEKRPVLNFKSAPLSFSREFYFSSNQLISQISSHRLTHVRPFSPPFSNGTLPAIVV
jgi:hypothetical protein